ncbi:MAG: acetate kinase [Hyphomicrobiales bacterium]
MAILVLNAGSSSLKFAVHDAASLARLAGGQVSGIGTAAMLALDGQKPVSCDAATPAAALEPVITALMELGHSDFDAVGHRMVHGGSHFTAPVVVDDGALAALEALRALAPLHLPFGLSVLRGTRRLLPQARHVACFDTAFHATQPEMATRLPLPRSYFDKGYRRYGFHGLNYEHGASPLPAAGNRPTPCPGACWRPIWGRGLPCAPFWGASVATTMGFSTADGLVMGTRTGSIDPGVLVALMRDEGLTLNQLEDLLYRKSGLLGLSGLSGDMRTLLASSDPHAAEAVDYYCHSVARHGAALAAAMGGIDAIVFTGGVGENAAPVRARVMELMGWLKIPTVHVIAANEELTIARHTSRLSRGQ